MDERRSNEESDVVCSMSRGLFLLMGPTSLAGSSLNGSVWGCASEILVVITSKYGTLRLAAHLFVTVLSCLNYVGMMFFKSPALFHA